MWMFPETVLVALWIFLIYKTQSFWIKQDFSIRYNLCSALDSWSCRRMLHLELHLNLNFRNPNFKGCNACEELDWNASLNGSREFHCCVILSFLMNLLDNVGDLGLRFLLALMILLDLFCTNLTQINISLVIKIYVLYIN